MEGVVWDGSPVIILIIAAVIYGVSFLLFSGMWKFILVWRHNPKEMAAVTDPKILAIMSALAGTFFTLLALAILVGYFMCNPELGPGACKLISLGAFVVAVAVHVIAGPLVWRKPGRSYF
ncbi:MAG: hypothetical protein GX604_05985 [Actinobacteria bacterium]|nr:hypothetical protein [Actinomycetota bacterium]